MLKRTRFMNLTLIGLILLFLFAFQASFGQFSSANGAAIIASKVGTRAGRLQFNLANSSSIVVWEDRKIMDVQKFVSTPFGRPDDRGTSDILGYNFSTNQPITVTDAPSDQTNPAISGSVVVWEDSGHSCPTCERDIYTKDLSMGTQYAVATG